MHIEKGTIQKVYLSEFLQTKHTQVTGTQQAPEHNISWSWRSLQWAPSISNGDYLLSENTELFTCVWTLYEWNNICSF